MVVDYASKAAKLQESQRESVNVSSDLVNKYVSKAAQLKNEQAAYSSYNQISPEKKLQIDIDNIDSQIRQAENRRKVVASPITSTIQYDSNGKAVGVTRPTLNLQQQQEIERKVSEVNGEIDKLKTQRQKLLDQQEYYSIAKEAAEGGAGKLAATEQTDLNRNYLETTADNFGSMVAMNFGNLPGFALRAVLNAFGQDQAKYATADELRIYAYYKTRSEDKSLTEAQRADASAKAARFRELLLPSLNARKAQAEGAAIEDWADENIVTRVLAGAGAAASGIAGGFDDAVNTVKTNISNAVTGRYDTVDPYASDLSRYSDALTSGATKDLPDGWKFLAETGISIAQNAPFAVATILSGGTLAPVGLAVMSISAAGQAARDATLRGATAREALAIGVMAGAVEAITEKIPLDNLADLIKTGGRIAGKKIVVETLKQAGIEAGEEFISEIVNTVADVGVMGENSEFEQLRKELIGQGKTESEATAQAFAEFAVRALQAGLGGAISGGLMGGVGVISSNIKTGNYGKNFDSSARQSLVDFAKDSGDKELQDIVKAIGDPGKMSNSQAGDLAIAIANSKIEGAANFVDTAYLRSKERAKISEASKNKAKTAYEAGNASDDKVSSEMQNAAATPKIVVDSAHKERQWDVIRKTNPTGNDFSTWIRSADEIKSFEEAVAEPEWDYDVYNPDYTRKMAEEAISSGEITVYSSYPISQGVFVTPSRMEAESYSADGKVYSATVPISDVAWIDPTQGMVAEVSDEYRLDKSETALYDKVNNQKEESANAKNPRRVGRIEPDVEGSTYQRSETGSGNGKGNQRHDRHALHVFVEESGKRTPPEIRKLQESAIIPPAGSELQKAKEFSESLGIPFYVIPDEVFLQYQKPTLNGEIPQAFAFRDAIFVQESYEANIDRVVIHELVHVMQHLGFEPISKLLETVPDHVNWSDPKILSTLERLRKHSGLSVETLPAEKIFGEMFAVIVAQKDRIYSDPSYLARMRRIFDNFDELVVDLQSAYDQFVAERKNQQSATETTQESRGDPDSQKWSNRADAWKTEALGEDQGKVRSLGDIVDDIRRTFRIPIATGRIRQRFARGIFKIFSESVRTRVSNALPTISHELGHYLDKKYGLRSILEGKELRNAIEDDNPGFLALYKPQQRPGEMVAEFLRLYLRNANELKAKAPFAYNDFRNALSKTKRGQKDLNNLDRLAKDIHRYMSASNVERDRAAIRTREETKKQRRTAKELFDRFQTLLIDSYNPIKNVSEKAYLRAYETANANSIVRFLIEDGMVNQRKERLFALDADGNKIQAKDENGKPLTDKKGNPVYEYEKSYSQVLNGLFEGGMKKISRETREETMLDFSSYLVMKHAETWLKSGKRVFADDSMNKISYVNEQVSYYEGKYPKFKEVSEDLNRWQRRFMKTWLVDTGMIPMDFYEKLWEKYPNYVPLNRDMGQRTRGGAKASLGNQRSGIKWAKGSGRDILNPLESIMLQMDTYVKAAERNAVAQQIALAAETKGGLGHLVERIPPNMVPQMVPLDELRSNVTDIFQKGENLSVEEVQDRIDSYLEKKTLQWIPGKNQGENVLWVLTKGKKTFYQIHDQDLLEALSGMSPQQENLVSNIAASITRAFKTLTTGSNIVWSLVSNSARDIASGYSYGSTANPTKYVKDLVLAYADLFRSDLLKKDVDAVKDYRGAGGGYQSAISNPKELNNMTREILGRKYSKDPQGVKDRIKWALEKIEGISDTIESAPRLAEFKRIRAAGGTLAEAVYAADEVTLNFKRRGTIGKGIDNFVPYFNASIQGLGKMARTIYADVNNIKDAKGAAEKIKTATVSFSGKTLLSSIVLMAIVMGFNGRDEEAREEYRKLSSYVKNNYYCFYIGNGHFIKIPKAKDVAFLESLFERTVEATAFDNDDAFYDFSEYVASTFLPPGMFDPFELLEGDWVGFFKPVVTDLTLFGSLAEIMANEDFTGAPIVPGNLQDLPAGMQYDERTSWPAKMLGSLGISPMQADHFLDSNLGIIWDVVQNWTADEKDLLIGVINKVLGDNAYSTNILNQFYEQQDDLMIRHNGSPEDGDIFGEYKLYQSTASVISTLNRLRKDAEDVQESRDLRVLSRDYADAFLASEWKPDPRSVALYERTLDTTALYSKTFSNEYTVLEDVEEGEKPKREKVVLTASAFMDYVEEYTDEATAAYDEILGMNLTDEQTLKALSKAKSSITDSLNQKYAQKSAGKWSKAKEAGISIGEYSRILTQASTDENANISKKEAKAILNASSLTQAQKEVMYDLMGDWKGNPYRS